MVTRQLKMFVFHAKIRAKHVNSVIIKLAQVVIIPGTGNFYLEISVLRIVQ